MLRAIGLSSVQLKARYENWEQAEMILQHVVRSPSAFAYVPWWVATLSTVGRFCDMSGGKAASTQPTPSDEELSSSSKSSDSD